MRPRRPGASQFPSLLVRFRRDSIGIGRWAEFRLFVPDLLNPSRGHVEDWLGRKELPARRPGNPQTAQSMRRARRLMSGSRLD